YQDWLLPMPRLRGPRWQGWSADYSNAVQSPGSDSLRPPSAWRNARLYRKSGVRSRTGRYLRLYEVVSGAQAGQGYPASESNQEPGVGCGLGRPSNWLILTCS